MKGRRENGAGARRDVPVTAWVVDVAGEGVRRAAEQEWVIADGTGGFAMGTVLGTATRRYHGVFTVSKKPPVGRVAVVKGIADVVRDDAGRVVMDLTAMAFRGDGHGGDAGRGGPGARTLKAFYQEHGWARWVYVQGQVVVTKEVRVLGRGCGGEPGGLDEGGEWGVVVRYGVVGLSRGWRIEARPLVSMKRFHDLRREWDGHGPRVERVDARGVVVSGGEGAAEIRTLAVEGAGEGRFEAEGNGCGLWWRGFVYAKERERGLDWEEDLLCPGVFVSDADEGGEARLTVVMRWLGARDWRAGQDADAGGGRAGSVISDARLHARTRRMIGIVDGVLETLGVDAEEEEAERRLIVRLALACDAFVVTRADAGAGGADLAGPAGVSIIAGYPWFGDWGRDSMIVTRGALIAGGRFEDALGVLRTFARHRRRGLIPNVFDDDGNGARYNTVDASLWFLVAACDYAEASSDLEGFEKYLLDACGDVVGAYLRGTDFGIGVDAADGLVFGGDAGTQLTWMDAQRDGVTFTPRHGKAVEVNALWHAGLSGLARVLDLAGGSRVGPDRGSLRGTVRSALERVLANFEKKFWDEARGWLFDRLEPDGSAWRGAHELRPNQVFAVSLADGLLNGDNARRVMDVAKRELWTPAGLRTLGREEPGYRGRYRGVMMELDGAYHNGTVWPWLMGAYVEGTLRVGGFSKSACAEAREAMRGLAERLGGACAGQLPEVYDGDTGSGEELGGGGSGEGWGERDGWGEWGGCPAQAWSVSELLRVLALVRRAERGVR